MATGSVAAAGAGTGATVTAIIPTYNRRDLVLQSARSVLGQSHGEVECLVVDNGSSDGTAGALTGARR